MNQFGFPDKTQDYEQAQSLIVSTLAAGASVFWNLATQQNAELTLIQNVTFMAPLGWKKGRLAMVEIIQGGVGSFTVAWNTTFKNTAAIVIQTTVGYSNILTFKCIDNGGVAFMSNNLSTRA